MSTIQLRPGKLGFRIGEVLVGLRRGTLDTPEVVQSINGGALRVSPSDFSGRQQFHTVFGEAVVGQRIDDISVQFQYGNSSYDVGEAVSGSGTTGNSAAMAFVRAGPTAGAAALTSRSAVRYLPGHEIVAQFTSAYEGRQHGVSQYHGLLNDDNGVAFGTQDGVFGVWFIKGGVEVFYPQNEWLGDKCDGTGDSGFVLDPSMLNVYMVQYGWLGTSPITFSIYTGLALGWVLVHWIDRVNQAEFPHLNNPALPMAARVVQSAGTGEAGIETASWCAGSVAQKDAVSDRWFSHSILDRALAPGTREHILTLRNETTFQGRTNHIAVELAVVSFVNDANKTAVFGGYKGATLSGATAYVPKDATSSVISLATGGTASGGREDAAIVVGKTSGARADVRGTGLVILPGETFTVTAEMFGGTGTASFAVRWRERF